MVMVISIRWNSKSATTRKSVENLACDFEFARADRLMDSSCDCAMNIYIACGGGVCSKHIGLGLVTDWIQKFDFVSATDRNRGRKSGKMSSRYWADNYVGRVVFYMDSLAVRARRDSCWRGAVPTWTRKMQSYVLTTTAFYLYQSRRGDYRFPAIATTASSWSSSLSSAMVIGMLLFFITSSWRFKAISTPSHGEGQNTNVYLDGFFFMANVVSLIVLAGE